MRSSFRWLLAFRKLRSCPLIALCLLCSPAFAQERTAHELENELRATFEGRVLTLRHFFERTTLKFNSSGELLNPGKPGAWTLYGLLEVTKVRARKNHVEFSGTRVFAGYRASEERLVNYRTTEPLTVKIVFSDKSEFSTILQEALPRIFAYDDSDFINSVPIFWRKHLRKSTGREPTASVMKTPVTTESKSTEASDEAANPASEDSPGLKMTPLNES